MSVEVIRECCKTLRCAHTRNNIEDLLLEAAVEGWSVERALEEILVRECEARRASTIARHVSCAKFPYRMTFDTFSTSHLSAEVAREVRRLSTLEFIRDGCNAVFVGNPGVGKTALAVAIGEAACRSGMRVAFANVPDLVIQMKEAMSANDMTRFKRNFERWDLVILDDLGYCSFSRECGEALFNLLSGRSETKSMVITTNLTFDRWEEVFGDPVLTGCIVDRLNFRSHVVDMTGDSYRVLETNRWRREEIDKKDKTTEKA